MSNILILIKKYWIFLILGLVLLFILITFLVLSTSPKKMPSPSPSGTISSPFPSPSFYTNVPIQDQSPKPSAVYSTNTLADDVIAKQDAAVTKLINALPYKGINIYLSYNYSNFQFVLQENELEEEASEEEFDKLLSDYGIADRSWLKNLFIQKIPGNQAETSKNPSYLFGP